MSRHTPDATLERCSGCGQKNRHPGEYTCRQGCTGSTAQMFNHVRPAHMQGRAVPVFAPWATKVHAS